MEMTKRLRPNVPGILIHDEAYVHPRYKYSNPSRIDISVYLRQRIARGDDGTRDEIIKSKSFGILGDVPSQASVRRHTQ